MGKFIDDETSRDLIRNNIDENYFVDAGAGSGKTSVLVDRMVKMAEEGRDISKICAITFTKAAAGEFYNRFQDKLSKSDSPNAKKALADIDLCFTGTIDSFCQMILSEHPMEAGIPSDAKVKSDDEMKILYRQAFSDIQKGKLGDKVLYQKCQRFKKYFWNAEDIFISGIEFLMKTKHAALQFEKPLDGTIDEILGNDLEEVKKILLFLCEHVDFINEGNGLARDAKAKLIKSREKISLSWDEMGKDALKLTSNLRLNYAYLPRMNEVSSDWETYFSTHERGKKWIEVNPDSDDPFLNRRISKQLGSIAYDCISDASELISEQLRKEGALTYYDFLYGLRNMLQEDNKNGGKLIRHIQERHQYYLLDEFQDTNPLQTEIFFYLTDETPEIPKESWRDCKPVSGSLFIVGDPKQSIYRFVNADVASFLSTRSLFEKQAGSVLNLTKNFRSTETMCEWFNAKFSALLSEDSENQSRFEPIPTGEKGDNPSILNGAYYYDSSSGNKMKQCDCPESVAKIIREIMDDPNMKIQVHGTTELRRPKYSDFMVIMPKKGYMSRYMEAFTEKNIPYRVEGEVLFSECPALISLVRVFSGIAGFYEAREKFSALNLSELPLTEEILESYAKKGIGMSPSEVLLWLVDELDIFRAKGTKNSECLYYALELLRTAEQDGTVCSLTEASRYLSSLIFNQKKEERCLQFVQGSDCVHLANLHKVKGLEAPIVILAISSDSNKGPSSSVIYSEGEAKKWVFNLDQFGMKDVFKEAYDKEQDIHNSELTRLLYVAATRASNVLIIPKEMRNKTEIRDSGYWYRLYLGLGEDRVIWNYLKTSPDTTTLEETSPLGNTVISEMTSTVFEGSTVSEPTYHIEHPSMAKLHSKVRKENAPEEQEETPKENPSQHENKLNAALRGTLVHRMMEVLVSSGDRGDLAELVAQIVKEYDVSDSAYGTELLKIGKQMRNGGYDQQTEVPKDILKELLSADDVFCELPFCYEPSEDVIWNGVMDVVYQKDGQWHILDYKTNGEADDLDEKYQEQLQAYKNAFREMTGEDADALIYHIGD